MRRSVRILTLAAIAPLTALALAACTPGQPLPLLTSTTPTPTTTVAPGPTVAVIATLARREVGEGTVVAVADEAAGTEWDVRVVLADGSVQEVHLSTDGAVVAGPSSDTTDADVESANRALVAAASITLAAAHTRMLAAVPGGRVTAIELDEYEDRVVWRGDVLLDGLRHDVRIDAVNGSVLLDQADRDPSASPSTPTGS
ncbi:PepSY domain-containing protein [Amnibacterium kyonggiense]|uniref:Peptidase YpeB-like protein n=1 Tax=Amnibacterium kyonggiense TaxID=595671 RepID=A0A4R7FMJ1_9MICO|nr:PepSY domain-containing protein [Amnibacterium kyonggiense]TDS77691.1 peptidase YpeB-like protein [Amnibacterium kyonggiense]